MRPKLKSDTFFVPMKDSVYVRNNEKSFAIKGKSLATWLERLTPLLDGRYELEQLISELPAEKGALLAKLIGTLVEQGYVQDVSADRPHTLSPACMETYGPAITFIEYHTDSGAYRFQKFLDQPVTAIGSGDCLLALARALLETGNRRISLLDTGEEETNTERLHEIVSALRSERDPELSLHMIPADIWRDKQKLQQHCEQAAMVLYCGLDDSPVLVYALNTLCQRAQVPFLPAVMLNDELHIGPLHIPEHPGCWQCYWRRWRAAHGYATCTPAAASIGHTRSVRSVPMARAAIGIAANILAMEFFKYETGVHYNTLENKVNVLELERLQNAKHVLFPHPLCTDCFTPPPFTARRQTIVDEITLLMLSDALPQRNMGEIEQSWADANCGIFSSIDDLDFYQLPLVRCQVHVPQACSTAYVLPRVQAAGLDFEEVRNRVSQLAVGRYLESLADPEMACQGTYQQFSTDALHPASLFGWLPGEEGQQLTLDWSWGVRLANLSPVLVPAAAVVPRSDWNQHAGSSLFSPDLPTTCIGADWYQTLAEGLCTLSVELTARDKRTEHTRTVPVHQLAPAAYAHDEQCAMYLEMLRILQTRVSLIDCTGEDGIPRLAAYLGDQLVGIAAHWWTLGAVRMALQSVVLAAQIRRTPAPGDRNVVDRYRDQRVGYVVSRTGQPFSTEMAPDLAGENEYVAAVSALSGCFARQRWDIVVVPLVKDRALHSVFPCALRVLAARRESAGAI